MIYLRLHQAGMKKLIRSKQKQRGKNFAIVAKFRYVAKISPVEKFFAPYFCVQTTPLWLISFLPSL